MTTPEWRQATITFPDPSNAEQTARNHLAPIMAEAERCQIITTWFYVRKDAWHLRYAPSAAAADQYVTNELERLVRNQYVLRMVPGIYEPESHAFGGAEAMQVAHRLWHHDSRHLLLGEGTVPTRHRETSIMLLAVMMRAAVLDWYEQGDVWARVADRRDQPPRGLASSHLAAVERLLTVDSATLTFASYPTLIEAYASAGRILHHLKQAGRLHRGLRDILAHHVIFAWNRRSIPGLHQAALAEAAKTVVFGPDPTPAVPIPCSAS
ncbi:thiopeptide-type bacteriocin biosynthesis protein [Actinoplanes couchii]|uniref:Thiopeptide-type bacteriocin biosynthesis domain-containing protein n=1 Tax=Actinoplanes couchii TaxID=403638 RepID=A0ABQ3XN24_9ACTN|nr:thiopeptide-type bacteriocin biosynthesis protein [Actinoplanes couchii]MDR6317922.1 thiopeptide-type bacteriocin biosynthesis protein [Actinoplanes couchii]GID59909.1 hypothetical protein Aco03nite_083130 [Actinoplanes couchii]